MAAMMALSWAVRMDCEDGALLGLVDGTSDGRQLGCEDGTSDGAELGALLGAELGAVKLTRSPEVPEPENLAINTTTLLLGATLILA